MTKREYDRSFTRAGDPIIFMDKRSFIFGSESGAALTELNQIIFHLDRLIQCCPSGSNDDIPGLYDIDLEKLRCKFQELRDGEFGDCVDWSTIAKAIRAYDGEDVCR